MVPHAIPRVQSPDHSRSRSPISRSVTQIDPTSVIASSVDMTRDFTAALQSVHDFVVHADAAANVAATKDIAPTGVELLNKLVMQFKYYVSNVEMESFAAGLRTGAIQAIHSTQPLQPHSSANTLSAADRTVRFTVHPSPRAVPSATRASIAMRWLIHSHCAGPPGHSSND